MEDPIVRNGPSPQVVTHRIQLRRRPNLDQAIPVTVVVLPTVTVNRCVALELDPLASVAETVMIDRPAAPGVIVTIEIDTLIVATEVEDDDAVYVSASPSGP